MLQILIDNFILTQKLRKKLENMSLWVGLFKTECKKEEKDLLE